VAGRILARLTLLAAALLAADASHAGDSATVAQTVTIADLFSPEEAKSFATTMRTDRKVTFRVRVPPGAGPHGVLVFVHPANNAQPMAGWPEILDRRDLVYIAADGFGNDKPGNQRALVALLALTHLSRTQKIDGARRYIGGMSGGGRVASQALARFPGFFSGALCIVGADWVTPDSALVPELATKRVVFMTGDGDFNRREIRRVYSRFLDVGVSQSHLLDLEDFEHQYPDADKLDEALGLLDRRATP